MMVGEIVARMRLDLTEFQSGLAKARSLLSEHAEDASRAAAILGSIGAGMAAGLAMAGGEAIKFEREMRNVNSIVQASEEDFRSMSEAVRALAKDTGQAPSTLAAGLYDIASSGFQGADGLKVLQASAVAATAGLTDTATASRAAMAVLNAYGKGADQIGQVLDVLFQTVNVGVITFPQLAQQIGEVVGTAAQAKVPLEEVGAAIATMTKSGIIPAQAITSLNQLLLSFIQPSAEAKKAAAELGLEWNATALASKGLSGMMSELGRALKLRSDEMEAVAKGTMGVADATQLAAARTGASIETVARLLSSVEALRGGLALARQEGTAYAADLGLMATSSGAAQKAFEEQSKSFGVMYDKARAAVQAWAAGVGSSLLPGLKLATALLTKLTEIGEAVPAPLRATVAAVAALSAAIVLGGAAWTAYNTQIKGGVALLGRMVVALNATRAAAIASQVAQARGGVAAGAAGAAGIAAMVKPGDGEALKAAADGAKAVAVAAGGMATGFRVASAAVRGFFATLGPIGWTLILLGTGIELWQLWRDHTEKAAEAAKQQAEAAKQQAERLNSVAEKLRAANDEYERAQDLYRKDPSLKNKQGVEAAAKGVQEARHAAYQTLPDPERHYQYGPGGKLEPIGAETLTESAAKAQELAASLIDQNDQLAQAARARDKARREAEAARAKLLEPTRTTKTVAVSSGIEGVTMEVPISAEEQRRARQAAVDAARKADAALGQAESQYNAVAAAVKTTSDALTKVYQGADMEVTQLTASEKQRHEQMQQHLKEEAAGLAHVKVTNKELMAMYTAERLNSKAAGWSAETKKLEADLLDSLGRHGEAAVRRVVAVYEAELTAARASTKEQSKLAELRLQADLKMRKAMVDIQNQMKVEEMAAGRSRAAALREQMQQETGAWLQSAREMFDTGKIGADRYLAVLEKVKRYIEEANRAEAQSAKAEGRQARPLMEQEYAEARRAQMQMVEEVQRAQEKLADVKERLHDEEMARLEEERQALGRLYQHEMRSIDLKRDFEAALRTVRGEDTQQSQAEAAAQYMREVAAARPQASESGVAPPAEALSDWAQQYKQATMAAWEAGSVDSIQAQRALREAMETAMAAEEELAATEATDHEERMRRHDAIIEKLGAEEEKLGGFIERATAGISSLTGFLAEVPDRLEAAIRRAIDNIGGSGVGVTPPSSTGLVGAMQGAGAGGQVEGVGRVVTEGGGGGGGGNTYHTNLYVNGQRISDMDISDAEKERLSTMVDEWLAKNMEHEQRYSRGGG